MKTLSLLAVGLLGLARLTEAGPAPLGEFLKEGKLAEALAAYAQPTTDAERFSLAVAQVLDGAQHFSAGFNRLPLNPKFRSVGLPFFRAVVKDGRDEPPQPATPAAVAALFKDLRASLLKANATLSQVEGKEDFGVTLNLREACADFSGDGKVDKGAENLQAAFNSVLGFWRGPEADLAIVVRFDRADAAWLRGYTYLISGIIDLLAAYDWAPVWAQCAHLIFQNPDPMPAIAKVSAPVLGGDLDLLPDLIAAIHEMRLELVDRDGPKRFRDSVLATIEQSRVCWQRAGQETDNDHEWLPNPKQTGPHGAKVTRENIDAWFKVLDELETIGQGKRLLPHWRMKDGLGINVEKLVANPPKLDLVLWLQGSAFLPYVEEGQVSNSDRWSRLISPFQDFFGFALWSN